MRPVGSGSGGAEGGCDWAAAGKLHARHKGARTRHARQRTAAAAGSCATWCSDEINPPAPVRPARAAVLVLGYEPHIIGWLAVWRHGEGRRGRLATMGHAPAVLPGHDRARVRLRRDAVAAAHAGVHGPAQDRRGAGAVLEA